MDASACAGDQQPAPRGVQRPSSRASRQIESARDERDHHVRWSRRRSPVRSRTGWCVAARRTRSAVGPALIDRSNVRGRHFQGRGPTFHRAPPFRSKAGKRLGGCRLRSPGRRPARSRPCSRVAGRRCVAILTIVQTPSRQPAPRAVPFGPHRSAKSQPGSRLFSVPFRT